MERQTPMKFIQTSGTVAALYAAAGLLIGANWQRTVSQVGCN